MASLASPPAAPLASLRQRLAEEGRRLLPHMAALRVCRLWGAEGLVAEAVPSAAAAAEAPSGPSAADRLAAARAAIPDRLWGEGQGLPGGRAEVLRLAALLPLSPATTLLLLGRAAGAGGAAASIAEARGTWIAAQEDDPDRAARAAERLRPLRGRAALSAWVPAAPAFRPRYHNHALALEPLACGAAPEPLARALAGALKPGGQLVLLDLVHGAGPPSPETSLRWLHGESRASPPPPQAAVERALAAAGFALHVVEDLGPRHSAAVVAGWAAHLRGLAAGARPKDPAAVAALLLEAERWMLRVALLRQGRLRLLRWHATLGG
jgi:SAM-dependent methyltransferase